MIRFADLLARTPLRLTARRPNNSSLHGPEQETEKEVLLEQNSGLDTAAAENKRLRDKISELEGQVELYRV